MAQDKAKVFFNETFQYEKAVDGQTFILKGKAMPIGETSRNGVYYRPESIQNAVQTLEKKPMLFNHNSDNVIGHVQKAFSDGQFVYYEANLDTGESDILRKLERGDIKHVSIGAVVSNPEVDEQEEKMNVDVDEFVELSLAPVPGYGQTTAEPTQQNTKPKTEMIIAENFQDENTATKLKEATQVKQESEESEEKPEENQEESKSTRGEGQNKENKQNEENPENEESQENKEADQNDDEGEETTEDKIKKIESQHSELFGELEELKNNLSALQSKVDSMLDGESESNNSESQEPNQETPENSEQSLQPDETETFESKGQPLPSQEKKDEVLNSESSKNAVVDPEEEILRNKSY